MPGRKLKRWGLCIALVTAAANVAWALGLQLSQSKEELELKYEVDCVTHSSGRVTVNLTINEQGKLKPIHDIQLAIPSDDGTGYFDLSVSMATRNVDGKLHARAHLNRELAERADIRIVTLTSPTTGKKSPRSWYYHLIPVAEHIRKAEQKPK